MGASGVSAGTSTHPKLPIRSAAISTDGQFYCIAGAEGRVHVQFVNDNQSSKNFVFRAHKTDVDKIKKVFFYNPINDIQFYPKNNITATCGSDGSYCFWDIAERSRLFHGPTVPGVGGAPQNKKCLFPGGERPAPILSSAFNAEGSVYAYGVGYDWNAGPQWNMPQLQVNAVVLHYIKPDDLKPKKPN